MNTKPLLEVELTAPRTLVPQLISNRLFKRSSYKLNQLKKWSQFGSALWVMGTIVGILGGHIIFEACIAGLGLMSLAMGIFRAT